MRRKLLLLSATGLALLVALAASRPAEARRGGHHGFSGHSGGRAFSAGPRSYSGPRTFHSGPRFYSAPRHSHGHHHHHHRRLFIAPFLYGGYYYYDYGSCAWLHRQALYTGSPYWWNRYYACIEGD